MSRSAAATLAESFSEVHELPGRNLMPVVDGAPADDARAVYLMTRDNMLEGDSGASGLARRLKRTVNPPAPLRIRIPAHVGSNFEGLVVRVDEATGVGTCGSWSVPSTIRVRGPSRGCGTWRPTGLAARPTGRRPLDDQWELYDLTADPIEAVNRWTDPDLHDLRAAPADAAEARSGQFRARAKPAVALCISPAAGRVTVKLARLMRRVF